MPTERYYPHVSDGGSISADLRVMSLNDKKRGVRFLPPWVVEQLPDSLAVNADQNVSLFTAPAR